MDTNVQVLNDLLKHMIDSQNGYEKAAEMVSGDDPLGRAFAQRAQHRATQVTQFQTRVRELKGQPITSGSAAGAIHQAWMRFSSLFQDDADAGLQAIDYGEQQLAEDIQLEIKQKALDPVTMRLLEEAWAQIKSGEAFAGRMAKAV